MLLYVCVCVTEALVPTRKLMGFCCTDIAVLSFHYTNLKKKKKKTLWTKTLNHQKAADEPLLPCATWPALPI